MEGARREGGRMWEAWVRGRERGGGNGRGGGWKEGRGGEGKALL